MGLARDGEPMRIIVQKHVRRPPADTFAWCTDFQDSDGQFTRANLRQRTILRRAPGFIEFEDRGILGPSSVARYTVRLHPPDRWEADVTSKMGTGHDEYRLFPDGHGTRIEIWFNLHPRGPYRLIAPFYAGRLRRRLSALWDDFVRAMESES